MTLIQQQCNYCDHWTEMEYTGYVQLESNHFIMFYHCSTCNKMIEKIEYIGSGE